MRGRLFKVFFAATVRRFYFTYVSLSKVPKIVSTIDCIDEYSTILYINGGGGEKKNEILRRKAIRDRLIIAVRTNVTK